MIGFNPMVVTDNFFYAEINKLTLAHLAKACGFNIGLPKVVMESGFPNGVVVGFTSNPKG